MYHETCRLLIGHNGHICNLHTTRLTGHIDYCVCNILSLQGFDSLVNGRSPFFITVKTYRRKICFDNPPVEMVVTLISVAMISIRRPSEKVLTAALVAE